MQTRAISELLKQSTQQLAAVSDSPRLDAEILLAHCLQKPRSYLYTWPEHTPEPQQLTTYNTLLQQRLHGQPIAYLTGYREFWGIQLKVTPDTLIPRPETELLVETALEYITEQAYAKHRPFKILDLGTGSGAIAIALSSELANANITITATDKSAAALSVARTNARQHKQHNITFLLSDWFSNTAINEKFDLIVSNPPYIATADQHLTRGDVRFEPQSALASGPDGLNDIRHIISQSCPHFAEDGLLMLEHGYDQAAAVERLLAQNAYSAIRCLKDLAGNDRISCGHYSQRH